VQHPDRGVAAQPLLGDLDQRAAHGHRPGQARHRARHANGGARRGRRPARGARLDQPDVPLRLRHRRRAAREPRPRRRAAAPPGRRLRPGRLRRPAEHLQHPRAGDGDGADRQRRRVHRARPGPARHGRAGVLAVGLGRGDDRLPGRSDGPARLRQGPGPARPQLGRRGLPQARRRLPDDGHRGPALRRVRLRGLPSARLGGDEGGSGAEAGRDRPAARTRRSTRPGSSSP
jgi:hypothetical protein